MPWTVYSRREAASAAARQLITAPQLSDALLAAEAGCSTSTIADAPSGAISYAEWLQGKIAARLSGGVERVCGPDVYDYPTIRDRLGLTVRPNAALERQLETRLRELEHQAKPEARLEAEAEIQM